MAIIIHCRGGSCGHLFETLLGMVTRWTRGLAFSSSTSLPLCGYDLRRRKKKKNKLVVVTLVVNVGILIPDGGGSSYHFPSVGVVTSSEWGVWGNIPLQMRGCPFFEKKPKPGERLDCDRGW